MSLLLLFNQVLVCQMFFLFCRFDFFFKQNVGSEDNFLGLSGKTPSSIHCDILVIKLTMPGEDIRNVDLRVTPDQIIVEGSR